MDAVEGDDRDGDRHEASPPAPAPEYVGLLSRLTPEVAERAVRHLGEAGIPFALQSDSRRGLRLGVARDRVRQAMEVLEGQSVVPTVPESTEGAVAAEGGPCPACGDHVVPGTQECPGCGLGLSGGGLECPHCGAEMNPVFDACADCGQGQD